MTVSLERHEQHQTEKISQFDAAMQKYNQYIFYNKAGIAVSTIIIFLQAITLVNLLQVFHMISPLYLIIAFISAYIMADFLGGIMHMYMDNNTNYTSLIGPFIAAFHLHHKTPQYKNQNPVKIYFYESGTKFWLVLYLLIVFYSQFSINLPLVVNFFLVAVGILSSIAEVSHYWCHNARSNQAVINTLQKYRILLSKKHHAYHHVADNVNYAFLNGVTDPIINKISSYLYEGYKNNADKHANAYMGKLTSNRF